MSDEQPTSETHIEQSQYDGGAIQNTVYVKWDVKGGRDRTHDANLNTCTQLEGSPGSTCTGNPDTFEGPTNGKLKVDARRYGAYKVVPR
ncbi:hypothetical protein F53441_6386 [Fusarium austroafricanum]|uniref:Uncharacterized protein n=1 Tax=Fusarium austroafricanum TaxID=2364996 RepID=A0A8H4KI11_9HYPO|nr:hypothetical protein F53441_6386 [Fusarium austroafricanum]